MENALKWKQDCYTFVGKQFDTTYEGQSAKRQVMDLIGKVEAKSIDYEIKGGGGYSRLPLYDTHNLNMATEARGFRTIIYPHEFQLSDTLTVREAKLDKSGRSNEIGRDLGNAAEMTEYIEVMNLFKHAFDSNFTFGDGKSWAATDHPLASKEDASTRLRVADTEAGTYSNLYTSTALSYENIKALKTAARKLKSPQGMPLGRNFDILLVCPQYEWLAAELLGGKGMAYKPKQHPASTNLNAANPFADLTYVVVGEGDEGLQDGMWGLASSEALKKSALIAYNTHAHVYETQLDNPLQSLFTAYTDFGIGAGDPRACLFAYSGTL